MRFQGVLLVSMAILACTMATTMSFDDYVVAFNKGYTRGTAEWNKRKSLFDEQAAHVEHHNAQNLGWTKRIDHMSDWTPEEFKSQLGFRGGLHRHHVASGFSLLQTGSNRTRHTSYHKGKTAGVTETNPSSAKSDPSGYPKSLDWTEWMNPVVPDQASCGSCWALAGAAMAEGVLNIATKTTDNPGLSSQQFVDCTANPHNCGGTGGCDGATIDLMLIDAIENGMYSDTDYPYAGVDEDCSSPGTPVASVAEGTHHMVESNSYSALMDAIQLGPVAISVDADAFNGYAGGVLKTCGVTVNHAVVLTGYGTTDNGIDYWMVRNSWGPNWGSNGYIKILRYTDGETHCGIDKAPEEGVGCDGGPSEVEVCGFCGILYAASYLDAGAVTLN